LIERAPPLMRYRAGDFGVGYVSNDISFRLRNGEFEGRKKI